MAKLGRRPSDSRSDDDRLIDHASIDRLTDDLLPALAAKLGASGLGEIEVREGDWKIRLRRPADGLGANLGRRVTDRPSRSQPGHAGHGHAPAALEGHRAGSGRDPRTNARGNGSHPPAPAAGSPGVGADSHRAVATSPAVGIFQPRAEVRPGKRVRAGDRLGSVDVLGVRQEVVAPVDGIVGATLVEAGDAVEYGQELIRIELASAPVGEPSGSSDSPGGDA